MSNPYDAQSSGTQANDEANQTTAYITDQFQRGATRGAIVAALVQNGWTAGDAEVAVTSAEASLQRRGMGTPGAAPVTRAHFGYPQSIGAQGAQRRPSAMADAARAAAARQMMIGGLWCVGGIVVTAITYSAAANNERGGTYMVFWGAILFGGIQFIRGLIGYVAAR